MDEYKKMQVFDFSDSEDTANKVQAKSKTRAWRKTNNKENLKKDDIMFNAASSTKSVNHTACCPMCRMIFTDDINNDTRALHISNCSGPINPTSSLNPKSNIAITCPVCNKEFSGADSANEKEIHINKCLDLSLNQVTLQHEKTDELLARSLQESINIPITTTSAEDLCLICFKDMRKYTIQQRSKHVNDCMDKGSSKRTNPTRKAKTTKQKASKTIKKTCPICKVQHPLNKFNVHMKKCASKNKLSTHQLLQIVREHNIELESKDQSTTSNLSSLQKATTTVVKPAEIDIMDKTIIQEHRNLLEEEKEIPSTPALPKSNLRKQDVGVAVDKPSTSSTTFKSKTTGMTNSVSKPKKACPLWDLAAYDTGTLNAVFLLNNLHPGLSDDKLEKDDNLLEASHSSVVEPVNQTIDEIKSIEDAAKVDIDSNMSFTATQYEKLDILLNLDDQEASQPSATTTTQNLEKDGFITDDVIDKMDELQRRSRETVLCGYATLVASPLCSDFVFHCGDGEDVPAHKNILSTFCEAFKKLIIEDHDSSVDFRIFSSSSVKMVMKFVYTGELSEPSTLSLVQLKEVKQIADRYNMEVLSRHCELADVHIEQTARNDNAKGKVNDNDDDSLDLNDIVSTFWQNEGGNETNDEENEQGEGKLGQEDENRDSAFSADELTEMREIFQSQRCVNDDMISGGEAEDDCFFVPDINKTLERSRLTSEDEGARSQLESDLLGESPRRPSSRTRVSSIRFEKSISITDTATNKHLTSLEIDMNKSSLDVVPPTSPKPELSVESYGPVPLNSYNSSVGSSAYADTQPVCENTASQTTLQQRKTTIGFMKPQQDKNKSVKLKLNVSKHKKRSSSSDVSLLNVTNDQQPETIVLDKSSQEKMQCKEITKVGSLLFSQEDFDCILGGYDDGDGSVRLGANTTESETAAETTADDESVRKQFVQQPVVVQQQQQQTNDMSSVILFPEENDDKENEDDEDVIEQTPPHVNDTVNSPAFISFATPSVTLKDTVVDNGGDGSDSTSSYHSLDDIEIPGLDHPNKTSHGRCLDDEMTSCAEKLGEASQNYNTDFTVTKSRIHESSENIITIEDDTQDSLMASMRMPEPCIDETIKSPPATRGCFVKASHLTTSTPHVDRDGTTKKQFRILQNQFHRESPIERQNNKEVEKNNRNNVILESCTFTKRRETTSSVIVESPKSSPPRTFTKRRETISSVVAESPKSSPPCTSSTKRLKSSSSSTENISSSCETTYMTASQKQRRQRKRRRKSNDALVSPIVKPKTTVAETSSSSDKDECVSESDSSNLFTTSGKSPKKHRRNSFNTPRSMNSSWLSTTTNMNTKQKQSPSLVSQSKTNAKTKGKTKTKKKKTTLTPKIRNEDFKKLLAKDRDEVDIVSSVDSDPDLPCTEDDETESVDDSDAENIIDDGVIDGGDIDDGNIDDGDIDDGDIDDGSIDDGDIEDGGIDDGIIDGGDIDDGGIDDGDIEDVDVYDHNSQPNANNIDDKVVKNVSVYDKSTDDEDNDDENEKIVIDDSPCEVSQRVVKGEVLSNDQELDKVGTVIISKNDGDNNEDCDEPYYGDENNEVVTNVHNDGDNNAEFEYDEPYYGEDENDMYFVDDGGYNSFNLEMPPGLNSQKSGSINSMDKSSLKGNDSKTSIKSPLVAFDENNKMRLRDSITNKDAGEDRISEKDATELKYPVITRDDHLVVSELQPDSFNISELNEIDSKLTNIQPITTTTPSSKAAKKNTFHTPTNPLLEKCGGNVANDSSYFETPPPPIPKDKDGCKNFQVGCSTHPETQKAITPMPNFGQLPTPDLKAEMKKFAIRDIPKAKMVSKLVEVYKYQHAFSHWEEEPPPKPTRKRKTKKDEQNQQQQQDPTTSSSSTANNQTKKPPSKKKKQKETTEIPSSTISTSNQPIEEGDAMAVIENDDVSTSSQKSQTTKKSKAKKEKKQTMTEEEMFLYIQGNSRLYQKILMYEPIEFNELVEELEKVSTSSINKRMLERFIDQQCICMKKEEAVVVPRRRGRKKKAT